MKEAKSPSRLWALNRLVSESRDLLEQSRAADNWIQMVTWEKDLRERLEILLADPWHTDEVAAVRIALQELLHLNEQAVATIEQRKEDILCDFRHVTRVQRAAHAYGEAAGA